MTSLSYYSWLLSLHEQQLIFPLDKGPVVTQATEALVEPMCQICAWPPAEGESAGQAGESIDLKQSSKSVFLRGALCLGRTCTVWCKSSSIREQRPIISLY
jgi:hypothetical protein